MRLNPHYPSWYGLVLGRGQFILGDYEAAEWPFVDVLKSTPEFVPPRAHLAATLAAMGRLGEARAEIEELIKVNPGYTLRNLPKSVPYKNEKDLDRFLDALRKVGLPE